MKSLNIAVDIGGTFTDLALEHDGRRTTVKVLTTPAAPEQGVMAIGSGGNYALAAARALVDTDKDAETIVRRALDIAADICVYTNRNVTIETLQGG